MKLFYTKKFEKRFRLLDKKIQNQFFKRIEIFLKNPNYPSLKNHPLKGNLVGCRAFSVTGNYRVTFRYIGKEAIKLIDIGTRNQVY